MSAPAHSARSASTLAPPETSTTLDAASTPLVTAGDVVAIVVNYRTPALTAGAIEHLLASDLPGRRLQVVIVDNNSGDGSVATLAERFPDLGLIVSRQNLGFAGGNNLAIESALRDLPSCVDRNDTFVLLINSDVEVEPDSIATCLAFMEAHPDTGIVGPKVVLPDGRLDLACRRGFPTPWRAFWKLTGLARRFPNNPRFTGYNMTHLDEDQLTEVDAVMGAFMLVRLAAIDAVGLLDERFFMYGEDIDWSFRIKRYGWRVYYVPGARVKHLKGATTRRQSYRMIIEFYRAMWLFHRKHYADRTFFLLNWLVAAGIVLRGGLAIAANALRPADAKRVS
ncbi:MAG TPA: glycosyltransferase family 2 protein [Thermomicrobiales bacterium]|nr:glycosyltransferase family 2 protein [Thermomicrobiales bacterium]